MPFFPLSTGANISGTFVDVGQDQINIYGHTKSTKQERFPSFYSHDPLQLSMKYLLPSTALRIIRDHLEPTATRALDKMSSQNLPIGLTTTPANRFVGSAAPPVMENRLYRTPLLNTMIKNAGSLETSSFSEAQVIEVSSVA